MAELRVRDGVLESLEDQLELALEAALLPAEWRVTILKRSERWFTLTIEMQDHTTTRLFPSQSTDAIIGFLKVVGLAFGTSPG